MSGCKKNTFVPQQLEPGVEYDDVYLLMGQSNASGVSPYSFLESSEQTLFQKYSVGNDKVKITFLIGKNRNGSLGMMHYEYNKLNQRFD